MPERYDLSKLVQFFAAQSPSSSEDGSMKPEVLRYIFNVPTRAPRVSFMAVLIATPAPIFSLTIHRAAMEVVLRLMEVVLGLMEVVLGLIEVVLGLMEVALGLMEVVLGMVASFFIAMIARQRRQWFCF